MSDPIAVPGLSAPAQLRIDRWGVAHIRADSLRDLFVAQGFNAARDRLWQIDVWRKRGLGLLAAELGPGFLEQDRAARLMLYRGDMAAEFAAYADDAQEICEAFAAGINAFVALCEREPERTPPEFAAAGMRPARWAAADVVRIRSHGLTRNALSEVLRANVTARAGAPTDLLRKKIEPLREAVAPEGLDLSAVPPAALDDFRLAMAPATITPERLAATLDDAAQWARVDDLGDVVRASQAEGSNNWTVSAALTDTGRPILASDPHRAHGLPGLRYLVHLTAPGFDAIGAGEPCVPGISLGHNGTAAFGLTIFGADQEDVHLYDTHPDDPDLYRYADGWERMRTVEERFEVRGCDPQDRTLKFTRHGPVLHQAEGRAVALRSVWFEPGSAPYMASLASMRARSAAEFQTALRRWGTPSSNMVYADTAGDIAWMPAGHVPVRPNWDGLLPTPGDGSHEWDGMLDPDRQPRIVNPAKGFFATANEMNLPDDWDHDATPIGFEWLERSRSARLHEVLGAGRPHSLADACALQTDATSVAARRLAAVAGGLRGATGDAARAVAMLAGFDGRLARDSAPAALAEVWWTRRLRAGLFRALAADPEVIPLLQPGDSDTLIALLEDPGAGFGPAFGPDPEAARDAVAAETLAQAWADCEAMMGDDPAQWAWGRLHHALFEHPLHGVADPDAMPDIGPFPMGGSALSPMHAGYRPGDFRVTHGASVRLVMDVGAWDRSLWINAPGQSGDPRSAHYADLAPIWAEGGYVPMLYSDAAVEAEVTQRIALVPG